MTVPEYPEVSDADLAAARHKVGAGAQSTLDAVRGFAQRAANLGDVLVSGTVKLYHFWRAD